MPNINHSHLIQTWACSIQFTLSKPVSFKSILMSSFHGCLGHQNDCLTVHYCTIGQSGRSTRDLDRYLGTQYGPTNNNNNNNNNTVYYLQIIVYCLQKKRGTKTCLCLIKLTTEYHMNVHVNETKLGTSEGKYLESCSTVLCLNGSQMLLVWRFLDVNNLYMKI
jgi:hypothetical protein